MNAQEVIKTLMLSPFYFRLNLRQRLHLVKDFCKTHQVLISGFSQIT